MAKYKANGYLLHNGSVVKEGEEVELTEEQAQRLGEKVVPASFDEGKKLEDYRVGELRELAKQWNIENYSEMTKDELVEALSEK